MKFKVDENLPVEVAQMLQAAGYDAFTVLELIDMAILEQRKEEPSRSLESYLSDRRAKT